MKTTFVVLSAIALLGCSRDAELPDAPKPVAAAQAPSPPPPIPSCPSLPSGTSLHLTEEMGPDFWICQALDQERVLLSIYVGNHPDSPRGLRFARVTDSDSGNLVWFAERPSQSEPNTWQWYTFVPFGHGSPSVMMVSFTTNHPSEFDGLAELAGQLQM